jgi:hypothetical protein
LKERCMHRKVLGVSLTAILVGAMLIPLAGTANAQVDSVTLDPQTDSAAIDTCNVFTATVIDDDAAAVAGTVVDARITQGDTDLLRDNRISFCDPLTGLPILPADLDDNAAANDAGVPTDPPVAGTVEGQANANTLPTGNAVGACATVGTTGECSFGVTSNEDGTMTVEAFAVIDGATVSDATPSTKTWTSATVDTVDCSPETDSNPEGSAHSFTCTALSGTAPIPGATIWFDVTDGPNAEEIAFQPCPLVTDATGTTTCTYTDVVGAGSLPGTDTIIGYFNLDCPRTGVTPCSNAPEDDEPQDEILKTFAGPARIIDCEPEEAENVAGTTHVVTCTVTDRAGNPVSNVEVTFTETGPGRFAPGGQTFVGTTDASGVATADLASTAEEEGDQTVTGEITDEVAGAPPAAPVECLRAAGDPAGAPAGACTDSACQGALRRLDPTQAAPPSRVQGGSGLGPCQVRARPHCSH